jgi:uncharacterized protein (TIGR03435 family)
MFQAAGGAGLIVLMSSGVFGQPAPSIRTFDVASVKLHQGPMRSIGISTPGLRLNADATNLRGLLMYAYNVRNYQVSGSAPLLTVGDTRYDIVAKAEGSGEPTRAEFRQMLQSLLADRFKLKFHREMREMPVYELVVGKNGPKFKESASDASPTAHFHWTGRNNEITMPKATMADMLDGIENSFLDRPVLDNTGLIGTYDIKLTYTPDVRSNRDSEPDLSDISIFTAVQDQLGLKLQAQKAMVEILIVDYAEKPSEN